MWVVLGAPGVREARERRLSWISLQMPGQVRLSWCFSDGAGLFRVLRLPHCIVCPFVHAVRSVRRVVQALLDFGTGTCSAENAIHSITSITFLGMAIESAPSALSWGRGGPK